MIKNLDVIVRNGDLDNAFPDEAYIFPGRPGLYPRFFLGTELHNASPLVGRDRTFGQEAFPSNSMGVGHFYFRHQYASHSCAARELTGVLLPVHTAPNTMLVQKLGQFTAKYHYTDSPSLAKPEAIEQLRRDLFEAAPLHVPADARPFDDVAEAFVLCSDPEQVLDWLKIESFEYIVEVKKRDESQLGKARQSALGRVPPLTADEANSMADRWQLSDSDIDYRKKWARDWKIGLHYNQHPEQAPEASHFNIKTKALPWRDITDFADWLSGSAKSVVAKDDIFTALIYENCD